MCIRDRNNTLCYDLDAAGYAVDSELTKSVASNFLTKQDYDLIVLDVNLPNGNGFDFCGEVKERRSDTAVIMEQRVKAKANKDWATSDFIRNELTALGFEVKDTKDGFEWRLNK